MSDRAGQKSEGKLSRARITVELGELSSKQRGAVLGLLKDMDFSPAEISEIAVLIPEEAGQVQAAGRRGKRK